jgi:dTDP-4-amino-4,6-dideoxygalactose transaminase
MATWNMCPLALEEAFVKYDKIGKLPKAVIVVHLYGLSADLDSILKICDKYGVPLIEDAAESLGTKYKGKYTGTFGKIGIYSFNGNKIITTSSGGMLVSDDEEMVKKVRFWATQSKDKARHFEHSELGYNYRMSNILAGIGRGQLKVLSDRIAQKRRIFDFYHKGLCDVGCVKFMPLNEWNEPNFWITCVVLNSEFGIRNSEVVKIIDALEAENIESRPLWKPMHLQPYYAKYDFIGTGVSDSLFLSGICLPSDTKMTDEDLDRVVKLIMNYEL